MRLKQFINENGEFSPDNWVRLKDTLERDCKPFIKTLRGVDHLLWRGVKTPPQFFVKHNVRVNRKPRMIDTSLHNRLNIELEKMYGWKARSEGLFTTKDEYIAKFWGEPSLVFPIGNFDYLWLIKPYIFDLYRGYDLWLPIDDNDDDKDRKTINDKNNDVWNKYIFPNIKHYHNKSLNKFLKADIKGSECIIRCKSYYSINEQWFETLLEYFSNRYWK